MDYQRLTQTILDLSSKRWDWNQGALSVRNPQVPKSQRNISRMIHTYTQMLHVWYICTYIWVIFAVKVDTYSITTWSIWDPAPQEFLPCFCWLNPYPHGWFNPPFPVNSKTTRTPGRRHIHWQGASCRTPWEIHCGKSRALDDCFVRDASCIYGIPGLVNIQKANWKIHPFYSWVNQLFRLGHFQ